MNIPVWLIPWKAKAELSAVRRSLEESSIRASKAESELSQFRATVDAGGKITQEGLDRLTSKCASLQQTCDEQAIDLANTRDKLKSFESSLDAWRMGAAAVESHKNSEIERLNARIEYLSEQVKNHRRALANTAYWIRVTHRVDSKSDPNTIRKLLTEAA